MQSLLQHLFTLLAFLSLTTAWSFKAWDRPSYTGDLLISATGPSLTTDNKCTNFPNGTGNRMSSYQWSSGSPANCYLFVYDTPGCIGNALVKIWGGQTVWYRTSLTTGTYGAENKARSYFVDCLVNLG